MPDHAPACIVGRFGHPGPGQFGTRYIAHDDVLGASGDGGRNLVRPVLAHILDLGVDRLNTLLFPGPLRHGQLVFDLAHEVVAAVELAIGAGDLIGEPQVDADLAVANGFDGVCNLALEVDVPTATGILGETAFFELAFDVAGQPQSQETTAVPDGITPQLDAIGFERYPPQRTLAAAPGQATLAE